MIGFSLSQYRIDAELGRGGMGIVYQATDTKLNRTVAIKVLPPAALSSEEDRARFFREAQSAAQLSHPNVCHVYQVDEAVPVEEGKTPQPGTDSRLFIAMEFIAGQTLQDYVKKGPMKLTEAVAVATQVAEALKAAHAKEIVHRDIKSANVMITDEGVAKVLDFGLAKTNQSTQLTRMGSTMGTVAYMSPEQARGQQVDGRTDLYSLGTMLYEMIAGHLPFDGEYEQAVVYSILNENPDPLTSLRTGVPMQLEWIVNKLLSKDAEYRYQTAADLLADLKTTDLSGSGHSRRSMNAVSASMTGSAATAALAAQSAGPTSKLVSGISPKLWAALATMIVFGVALGWVIRPVQNGNSMPAMKLPINLPVKSTYMLPTSSPDGRYWALSMRGDGQQKIRGFIWDTEANLLNEIPGTEGLPYSKFSPDGSWLALGNNNHFVRVRVDPIGSAIPVDSSGLFFWIDNEHMLVGSNDKLDPYILSLETSVKTPVPLPKGLDSTYTQFWTWERIPNTTKFLFTGETKTGKKDILSMDWSDGSVKVVLPDAFGAQLHQENTIVYIRGPRLTEYNPTGKVIAQRFDTKSASVLGTPVDLYPEDVIWWQVGVGKADQLFVLPLQTVNQGGKNLAWLDPKTKEVTPLLDAPNADYERLSLSPNGTEVAIEKYVPTGPDLGRDIYILKFNPFRESKLTYNGEENRAPVWGASGKVYWARGEWNDSDIVSKNADLTGDEKVIVENGEVPTLCSDEQWIAYVSRKPSGDADIYAKNLKTGNVVAVDTTSSNTGDPSFSPDCRFIAYSLGTYSGRNAPSSDQRIYIRSFPDTKQYKRLVVDQWGDNPSWSSDGTRLYFTTRTDIAELEVRTEDGFEVLSSTPKAIMDFAAQSRSTPHPSEYRLLVANSRMKDLIEDPEMQVWFKFSSYLDKLFGDRK